MNILLTGSSTILGAQCIEHFFAKGHTIFSLNTSEIETSDLLPALQKRTSGKKIDMLILTETEHIYDHFFTSKFTRQRNQNQLLEKTSAIVKHVVKNNQVTILLSSSIAVYQNSDIAGVAKDTEDFAAKVDSPNFFDQLECEIKRLAADEARFLCLRFGQIISNKTAPVLPQLPIFSHLTLLSTVQKRLMLNWVSLDDVGRAISFLIENEKMCGAVNITSGDTIQTSQLLRIVSKKCGSLKTLVIPGKIYNLIAGRESEFLFNCSTLVIPERLNAAGFSFKDISVAEYLGQHE